MTGVHPAPETSMAAMFEKFDIKLNINGRDYAVRV